MVEFPFEKRSTQATSLSKWVRAQIAENHIALEFANEAGQIARIQGKLTVLREILANCEVSAVEIAQAEQSEHDEQDMQPIPIE